MLLLQLNYILQQLVGHVHSDEKRYCSCGYSNNICIFHHWSRSLGNGWIIPIINIVNNKEIEKDFRRNIRWHYHVAAGTETLHGFIVSQTWMTVQDVDFWSRTASYLHCTEYYLFCSVSIGATADDTYELVIMGHDHHGGC